MQYFHGTGADLLDGGSLQAGAVGGDIDPECELMRVWATRTHADAIEWAVRVWRTSRAGDNASAYVYEVELFGEIEDDPNCRADSSVMATGGKVIRRVATYRTPEEAAQSEVRLRANESVDK